MSDIADFDESEQTLTRAAPIKRVGHEVKFKLVDAEICVCPADRTLTKCPV